VRGKQKAPTLRQVSLRLDKDVYDYIATNYPNKIQATIRAVLKDYVTKNGERNDNDTSNIQE
jgi:uncharacterized protein (DUF4415 family)